jgi:hypothetical protein
VLRAVRTWDARHDELLLLLADLARAGRLLEILEPPGEEALMGIHCNANWRVRELVLEILWDGFLGLATNRERVHVMNAGIFVAMVCGDQVCLARMQLIVAVVGEIARSDAARQMAPRAVEMTVELMQIALDAEEQTVVGEAEAVLAIYQDE